MRLRRWMTLDWRVWIISQRGAQLQLPLSVCAACTQLTIVRASFCASSKIYPAVYDTAKQRSYTQRCIGGKQAHCQSTAARTRTVCLKPHEFLSHDENYFSNTKCEQEVCPLRRYRELVVLRASPVARCSIAISYSSLSTAHTFEICRNGVSFFLSVSDPPFSPPFLYTFATHDPLSAPPPTALPQNTALVVPTLAINATFKCLQHPPSPFRFRRG